MYSRENPSESYNKILERYKALYMQGHMVRLDDDGQGEIIPPGGHEAGDDLLKFVTPIQAMIQKSMAKSLLDYGSGKGLHYGKALRIGDNDFANLGAFWQVDEIVCYDPCVAKYQELPVGRFDGVISTYVLEHVPESDIDWVLDEMFHYASSFVFACVANFVGTKILPFEDELLVTTQSAQWWGQRFSQVSKKHDGVDFTIFVFEKNEQDALQLSVVTTYSEKFWLGYDVLVKWFESWGCAVSFIRV